MSRWRHAFLLVTGLVSAVALGSDSRTQELEGGFEVSVPAGVSVTTESPVEDFVLYRFVGSTGENLLTLYVGNHPAKRKLPINAQVRTEVIIGLRFDFTRWIVRAGSNYADVRVSIQEHGWPSTAQFSYSSLTDAQATIAESIVKSFRRCRNERK